MVESLYFVPTWFYNIDIILSTAFALVTGIVAFYASKLYSISYEREFKLFSISFVCLSLSYILRIFLNSFLTTTLEINKNILRIADINLFTKSVIYLYVFLFIGAYITLAYTTLKLKGIRTYFLMLIPSLIAFTFSFNKSLTLYLLTSVFILSVIYHYQKLYRRNHEPKRLAMLIAMTLLLLSNIISMFIADYQFYYGYILSNALELFAYFIFARILYRINKYGEKKN